MPKPTRESLWRARPDLPKNPYKDNDLKSIVRAIESGANCHLSAGERNHLYKEVTMVARAFIRAQHQFDGPTLGQIEAALEELHIAADKLLRIVNALDDATLFALRRQHWEFDKEFLKAQAQNDSSEKTQTSAKKIVSNLSAEAKAAIKAVKEVSKRHPPPDENPLDWPIDWDWDPIYRETTPVTMLVIRLAFIFYEVTGEEPLCKRRGKQYHGNFLPFVRDCLSPLEKKLEKKPRKALGKTIQEALPMWRGARDARA